MSTLCRPPTHCTGATEVLRNMLHELPALHGVHVIDFGISIAGPLVARMLQDAGATVTRIEQPGRACPSYSNPGVDMLLNSGKRREQIALTSEAGLRRAKELIAKADVIVRAVGTCVHCSIASLSCVQVENFRGGVMEKLGLGREAVLNKKGVRLWRAGHGAVLLITGATSSPARCIRLASRLGEHR